MMIDEEKPKITKRCKKPTAALARFLPYPARACHFSFSGIPSVPPKPSPAAGSLVITVQQKMEQA